MRGIALAQREFVGVTRMKSIWSLLKETGRDWLDDEATRLAASLAYYTLLSLAPLIVLAIALAGLVFDEEAARGQIAAELGRVVGPQGAQAIEAVVQNAEQPQAGLLSSLFGLGVLLFGASGVFSELQSALNRIWEVAPRPRGGLWGTLRSRLFSFAMVMSVAFLLLVSLILSAALSAAGEFFRGALPGGEPVWQVVNFALSFGVVTALFALLLKYVPDARIAWRDVWIGAAVTALLFDVGKLGIALYLGKTAVSSAYGAAGSVVLLVIWVYYSSLILFLGAEFTQVYARRFGSSIQPGEGAVSLADDARARRGHPAGA
jgi:membrane protein